MHAYSFDVILVAPRRLSPAPRSPPPPHHPCRFGTMEREPQTESLLDGGCSISAQLTRQGLGLKVVGPRSGELFGPVRAHCPRGSSVRAVIFCLLHHPCAAGLLNCQASALALQLCLRRSPRGWSV